MSFLDNEKWRPKRPETPAVPQEQRSMFRRVLWGATEVTLRSVDGVTWEGASGEPGLVLVVRMNLRTKQSVASIEDRAAGQQWRGEPKFNDGAAVANLRRELRRVAKAGQYAE